MRMLHSQLDGQMEQSAFRRKSLSLLWWEKPAFVPLLLPSLSSALQQLFMDCQLLLTRLCAFLFPGNTTHLHFPAFPATRCGHVSEIRPIACEQKRCGLLPNLPIKNVSCMCLHDFSHSAGWTLMSRVTRKPHFENGKDAVNLGLRMTLLSIAPFPFPTYTDLDSTWVRNALCLYLSHSTFWSSF